MTKKIRFARVNARVDDYVDSYVVIMDDDFDPDGYLGEVELDITLTPQEEIEVLCEEMDSYSEGENYHNDIGKPQKLCDMVTDIAGDDAAVRFARMLYLDRNLFGGY